MNDLVHRGIDGGVRLLDAGFRSFEEMVGHSEALEADPGVDHWKAAKLDLLPILRDGRVDTPLAALLRPAYFVPDSKPLDELLRRPVGELTRVGQEHPDLERLLGDRRHGGEQRGDDLAPDKRPGTGRQDQRIAERGLGLEHAGQAAHGIAGESHAPAAPPDACSPMREAPASSTPRR